MQHPIAKAISIGIVHIPKTNVIKKNAHAFLANSFISIKNIKLNSFFFLGAKIKRKCAGYLHTSDICYNSNNTSLQKSSAVIP